MSKFHIKKITEIDNNRLLNFYQKSFNYEKLVLDNFKWRYRSKFSNYEPLVLLENNEICGHAGLIPVDLKINNKIERSIWFTDLFVEKKYRSRGFGQLLTKEWMKICPIQITLCNDQSLRVFKKFNWSSNNNFVRKIKFFNFVNILPFFRKIKNSDIFTNNLGNLKLEEIDNQTLNKIINEEEKNLSNKNIGIVRDQQWFDWRINKCPYKRDIYIFSYNDLYLIVHIKIKNNLKILNLVYSTRNINDNLIKLLLSFAKENKIDYLSYLSKNKSINFNFPWERKLNFAFYSVDDSTKKLLNKNLQDIQYIDSDLDYI